MSSASAVGAPPTEDTKTRRELMLEGVLAHLERNIDPQVDDRSLEIWRGLLKSVGSAGIWRAQEELGKCYFFGSHGFVKDGKQAWEWFNKEPYSSGKRDVAGRYQYWLGRCYFERFFFEGRGVGKDVAGAFENCVEYCEADGSIEYLVEGQAWLGFCYLHGVGVAQNDREGVRLCRLAADQGHLGAQTLLSVCFHHGIRVELDYAETAQFFQSTCDANHGHAVAQYNLGVCYRDGHVVKQDYAEAARLFQVASDKGWSAAQEQLGLLYSQGLGVQRNCDKALFWLRHSGSHPVLFWKHLGSTEAKDAIKKIKKSARKLLTARPAVQSTMIEAGESVFGQLEDGTGDFVLHVAARDMQAETVALFFDHPSFDELMLRTNTAGELPCDVVGANTPEWKKARTREALRSVLSVSRRTRSACVVWCFEVLRDVAPERLLACIPREIVREIVRHILPPAHFLLPRSRSEDEWFAMVSRNVHVNPVPQVDIYDNEEAAVERAIADSRATATTSAKRGTPGSLLCSVATLLKSRVAWPRPCLALAPRIMPPPTSLQDVLAPQQQTAVLQTPSQEQQHHHQQQQQQQQQQQSEQQRPPVPGGGATQMTVAVPTNRNLNTSMPVQIRVPMQAQNPAQAAAALLSTTQGYYNATNGVQSCDRDGYRAAGVLPVRYSLESSQVECLLAIEQRHDSREPALNFLGGRRDHGETLARLTAAREFSEEVGQLIKTEQAADLLKSGSETLWIGPGKYFLFVLKTGKDQSGWAKWPQDYQRVKHLPGAEAQQLAWVSLPRLLAVSDPRRPVTDVGEHKLSSLLQRTFGDTTFCKLLNAMVSGVSAASTDVMEQQRAVAQEVPQQGRASGDLFPPHLQQQQQPQQQQQQLASRIVLQPTSPQGVLAPQQQTAVVQAPSEEQQQQLQQQQQGVGDLSSPRLQHQQQQPQQQLGTKRSLDEIMPTSAVAIDDVDGEKDEGDEVDSLEPANKRAK